MADEVRLFGRLSLYALVVGTIYWFVSYEVAGTVLLLGFGLATGLAFIILWRRDRKVRARGGRAMATAAAPAGRAVRGRVRAGADAKRRTARRRVRRGGDRARRRLRPWLA